MGAGLWVGAGGWVLSNALYCSAVHNTEVTPSKRRFPGRTGAASLGREPHSITSTEHGVVLTYINDNFGFCKSSNAQAQIAGYEKWLPMRTTPELGAFGRSSS